MKPPHANLAHRQMGSNDVKFVLELLNQAVLLAERASILTQPREVVRLAQPIALTVKPRTGVSYARPEIISI